MKILFSDFDGTLTNQYKIISQRDIDMMKKLQEEGHCIVICTGRNIREFQSDKNSSQFPFDYVVLNNGGHIIDKNYHTLYEKVIDYDVGVDILNKSTQCQGMWSNYCDGKVTYSYLDGKTYDHSKFDLEVDEDFFQLYKSAKHFQILCINQADEGIEESLKCCEYIKEHYSDQVEYYFNNHYVDIVPKGCSKGTGIRTMLSLIKEPIDAVYAIGDSFNDLPMIQEADYGYTFHHAHDDMKQATKYHVHYVYEMIEDMLGEEK